MPVIFEFVPKPERPLEAVDNSELVASFLPVASDDDTFWYTEILDRTKRAQGDNRKRVLRLYRHHCRSELLDLMPAIRKLCDGTGARAYTRLSARSHEGVGKELLRLTAEMVCNGEWRSGAYLYARACGRTNIHGRRLWLYDVDVLDDATAAFERRLDELAGPVVAIPSRKGKHLIVKPHDPRLDGQLPLGIGLQKDNPTNLYIPGDKPAETTK